MANETINILTVDEFIDLVVRADMVTKLINLKVIKSTDDYPDKIVGTLENTIKVDDMTFCYCSDFIFRENDIKSIDYFNDIGFDINMGEIKLIDDHRQGCGLAVILNILDRVAGITNFNKVLTALANKMEQYGGFLAYFREAYPLSTLVMDEDILDTCSYCLVEG